MKTRGGSYSAAAGRPVTHKLRKSPSKIRRRGPKTNRARKSSGTHLGSRAEAAVAARYEKWLNERAQALQSGLFQHGYFVMDLPKRFRMKAMPRQITTHFVSTNKRTRRIFQKNAYADGRCNVGDGKRSMLVCTPSVRECASMQHNRSMPALVDDLTAFKRDLVRRAYGSETIKGNTPSFLLSTPSDSGGMSSNQSLHTDGDTTAADAIQQASVVTLDNPVSFSAQTSFQGCSLTIVKGSHLEVRKMSCNKSYSPAIMYGETVVLKTNQVIFFTQDLIHAGDGYAENNLRFHMYFDHVNVKRARNATNPLPDLFGKKRANAFQFQPPK